MCDCEVCKRNKLFKEMIEEIPEKWKDFITRMYKDLEMAEQDYAHEAMMRVESVKQLKACEWR